MIEQKPGLIDPSSSSTSVTAIAASTVTVVTTTSPCGSATSTSAASSSDLDDTVTATSITTTVLPGSPATKEATVGKQDAGHAHHEEAEGQHTPSPLAMTAESAATQNGASSNGSPSSSAASTTTQTYTVEYLSQLLKDKKQLAAFPNVFHHLERLADEEIGKVRVALFQCEFTKKETVALPEADGEPAVLTEKVFVPAKDHPDYNFVGRILGPRGMTAKQLEQETGCKIMVRGRGSMRDKKKEELNRGKPNWEHLSEELHVLIQCEDSPNRARLKLLRAVEEVKKLLVPAPEGEDELKRKQLMELAIINGTYRSASQQAQQAQQQQQAAVAAQLAAAASVAKTSSNHVAAALQAAAAAAQAQRGAHSSMASLPIQLQNQLAASNQLNDYRNPTLAGAPIILSPSRTSQNNAAQAAAAAQMLQQQQQNQAAAVAAAQQAALIQQQQQQLAAADYQQMLLSSVFGQGLSYDGGLAAMQQFAAAAAHQQQNPAVSAAQYSMYGAADPNSAAAAAAAFSPDVVAAAQAAAAGGAMLCTQRRVLGQSRDHPYKQ